MTSFTFPKPFFFSKVGKELTYWLSACAVLLYAVLMFFVPFLFGVWGRKWNSIVSVPDYFFLIYFN